MTNSLRKYVAPTITPAAGGRIPVGQTDGLLGYNPAEQGGFYPTAPYALTRTLIDATGALVAQPEGFPNYRLVWEWLTQMPGISEAEAARAIALSLRGQYDPRAAYAYVQASFNVWSAAWPQPYITPQAEIYDQVLPGGWTGGALTASGFAGIGAFAFTTTKGTVAAVGLAPAGADPNDPSAVVFGFLFRGYKGVSAIEQGVETVLSPVVVQTDTTAFKVEYAQGRVTYFVDGVAKRQTTAVATNEMWFGLACLNSPNADVRGVSIGAMSGAALVLPRFQVRRRGANLNLRGLTLTSRPAASGAVVLRALRTAAHPRPGGATVLPRMAAVGGQRQPLYLRPLTASGGAVLRVLTLPRLQLLGGAFPATGLDQTYGEGRPTLPKFGAKGYAGRVQQLGGMLTLPRIRAIASGGTGQLGHAALAAPKLVMRSASYASAALALPAVRALGIQEPADEAFISSAPFLKQAAASQQLIIVVTITAGGGISSALAASLVRDATLDSTAAGATSLVGSDVLQALMTTVVKGASFEPLSEEGAETWVINADTAATSFYENFSFNSFGTVAERMYGARADGVYLLEGDTDAGSAIRASMSFGATDFSTAQLKRLEYAYVGLASSGTMYLKVKVRGGDEYTYAARRSDDYMAVQRIDVGRGIRASYLAFEIYNSDGCDFELNTVEFHAAELTRRI